MRRPSTWNKQEAKVHHWLHSSALGRAERADGWAALLFAFLRKLYKRVNAQRNDSTHFFRIPAYRIENLGLRIEELPKESEGLYNPPRALPAEELPVLPRWPTAQQDSRAFGAQTLGASACGQFPKNVPLARFLNGNSPHQFESFAESKQD